MPNYDLSTPVAISDSAKLARKRADEEPNQSGYNAAWLHGYADALLDAARQLEPQQKLIDAIIGYMGEQHDSAELYAVLHDRLEMTDEEIVFLGFDLPQCHSPSLEASSPNTHREKRRNPTHHER